MYYFYLKSLLALLSNHTSFLVKHRRLRGDMIEVYKITHDMYDRTVALELPRNVSSTRGNKYKWQHSLQQLTTFENFLLLHE